MQKDHGRCLGIAVCRHVQTNRTIVYCVVLHAQSIAGGMKEISEIRNLKPET